MKFGRFIAPVSDLLRQQVWVRLWRWLRRGAALSSCGQNVPCLGRRRQLFHPRTEDLTAAELSALVCVFQMRNLNWNNWKGTCDVADGFIVVEHHVEVRDGFILSQYWANYWECHICPHVALKAGVTQVLMESGCGTWGAKIHWVLCSTRECLECKRCSDIKKSLLGSSCTRRFSGTVHQV